MTNLNMTIISSGWRLCLEYPSSFIIDWFTKPPTLVFGKLKKKTLKISVFLFPPILIFILIMNRNIKNIKNSALIPQYNHNLFYLKK